MATDGNNPQDELRVVLLGKIGAGKSSLANRILGADCFRREETGLCVKRQGKHGGRTLTVVDTPGWDRLSVRHTPEKTKQEIIQSVRLCYPGPHALLVVLPITAHGNLPSVNELKSVSHHVELFSKRAWRYTLVVFVCSEDATNLDSVLNQHKLAAKRLIGKCNGRCFVLRKDSQIPDLLLRIEEMVEENKGDFLFPQVYYEAFERRIPSGLLEQAQMFEKREEELQQSFRRKIEEKEEKIKCLEDELHDYKTQALRQQRRGSYELIPPEFADASPEKPSVRRDSREKQMITLQTVRRSYHEEIMAIIKYYMKPIAVLVVAIFGALMGAVVGATEGVHGSSAGMVKGSVIGVLIAILCIGGTRLVRSEGMGGFLRVVGNCLRYGQEEIGSNQMREDERKTKKSSRCQKRQ